MLVNMKMREAIKRIRDGVLKGEASSGNLAWIVNLCDECLAMPPRNCDVGTAEEHAERFKKFCRNHQFISVESEDGFPPVYVCSNESCPLHDYYIAHGEDSCELAWAQMPYAEEGGAK